MSGRYGQRSVWGGLQTKVASVISRSSAAGETYKKLSADSYRTLGVAVLEVGKRDVYTPADEWDMTPAGFAACLDPSKEGIHSVLEALKQNGISVVIMTGAASPKS